MVAAAATTTTGNGARRMAAGRRPARLASLRPTSASRTGTPRWQQRAEGDDGRAEQGGVAGAAVGQRGLAQHHEPFVIK